VYVPLHPLFVPLRVDERNEVPIGVIRIIILDDKEFSKEKAVIPMAMAIGRLNIALLEAKVRHLISMIAITDEVQDSHSAAVLIGYGANALYPKLLFFLE